MKNLYDLLGARPDDDAENIRKAYRKAAKASHPDLHGGDQGAAARFRQIVTAFNTLRDAKQRAAYDRVLFRRKPLRAKLKQTIVELKHHIFQGAVVAAALTIVLASGYTLFVRISETPVDEAAGTTGDDPARTVAARVAQRDATERDKLDRVAGPLMPILPLAVAPAANDPAVLEMTTHEPVPRQAEQTIHVAARDDHSEIAIDQPSATAGGDPGKSQGIHLFDRHEADPNGENAGDVKAPEIKAPARPLVKRQVATLRPFKQALLKDRNASACTGSQTCGGVPPLFGVGF
jgi:curved DNA-binding protein CbpA